MGLGKITSAITEAISSARLLTIDGKIVSFELPFNPTSFKLSRNVSWAEQAPAFQPYTNLTFGNGAADKLTFDMLLDETESKRSVLTSMRRLYRLTTPGRWGEVIRPPETVFIWEAFIFQGVVSTLDFDVTLFDESGTPKRATVSVTMTGKALMDGKSASSIFGPDPSFF